MILLQNWTGLNWDSAAVWIWQLGNYPKKKNPSLGGVGWLLASAAKQRIRKEKEDDDRKGGEVGCDYLRHKQMSIAVY